MKDVCTINLPECGCLDYIGDEILLFHIGPFQLTMGISDYIVYLAITNMRWDRGFFFMGSFPIYNHLQLVVYRCGSCLFVTCRVMWSFLNVGRFVVDPALKTPPGLFSAAHWGTIGGPSSRIRTTGACEAAQTQVRSLHRRASNPWENGWEA